MAPKNFVMMASVHFNKIITYYQTHITASTLLDILSKPALFLFVWGLYKS
jgi:hypothetical protein